MRCVANDFIVNVRKEPTAIIRKYEQDIAELQQELAMHDSLTERHQIIYGQYTDAQKAEVSAQVQAFLQSEDSPDSIAPLQLISLRHMKEVLIAAKVQYQAVCSCTCYVLFSVSALLLSNVAAAGSLDIVMKGILADSTSVQPDNHTTGTVCAHAACTASLLCLWCCRPCSSKPAHRVQAHLRLSSWLERRACQHSSHHLSHPLHITA